jgi:hypothetical protein
LGGIHSPDNIENDRHPGGGVASWAHTGWHVAAVTLIDLLCVFVQWQGGDCCLRYLPSDESWRIARLCRKQWRWISV